MSELLKSWLERDVGLQVDNFERDFASGYLFGQLFSRYNMQPDIEQFDAKRMPDSMINNYTRLQPTFTKLGVQMDTRVANQLIREEPGVAARLLYSIKQNIGNLNKGLSSFQHTGNLGRSLGASVSPSRTLLDAQKHNTQKEAYNNSAHRHFEETLRAQQATTTNALMESMHLQPYSQEGMRQKNAAIAGMMRDRTQKASDRDTFRATQMDKLASARSDKSQRLSRDEAVHAALLKRKEDAEREELRVELALSEKAHRKKLQELHHASLDVNTGIDAFEINMKRLVRGDQGEGEETLAPPAGKSPLEHMEKMKGRAVATAKLLEDTAAYMRSVQEGRADDVAAKREREARRRKMVVEQQAAAAVAERKAQAEALLAALQRQSTEEQRLAARLWQVGQEKEAMRENRAMRERQYAERREKDWEDTLKREMELHRSMRQEYEAAAAVEMETWRAAQAARAAAKTEKHKAMAAGIAWQLVQLAERCADYRSASGALVPAREWRQWLAMFISGDPALGPPVTRPTPEQLAAEAAERAAAARLSRAAVEHYLACSGDWVCQEGPIGYNELMGRVVGELAVLGRDPAPPPQAPALDGLPLRLAVLGAPFSGKSAVAQELARKYRLRVLEPEGLIVDALAEADQFQKQLAEAEVAREAAAEAAAAAAPPDADAGEDGEGAAKAELPPLPEPSARAALGQQVRQALRDGVDVPNATLVGLMVEAMKATKDWTPPPEPDPKAKGRPAAAGAPKPGAKGAPPAEPARGFVLDGFPRNAEQAQLMERMLTGLDLDVEQALVDSASAVAPPPPEALPQVSRPLVSALDAVVVCGLADESIALKRAIGRRVDPATGRVYHLEFDPPPSNDPGLSARLKEVSDASNEAQQIQKRLAAYIELATPLDDWLRRFSRLRRPVDGSGPLPEVLASAAGIADGLLRAKAAAASCRSAAEAAQKARASAEQAHEYAVLAQGAAESAAQELLLAKKAEIQAAALLAGGKNPDPAATEVLKAQAAAKCAEQLKVARGAVNDANNHAERATASATTAAEAVERAHKSLGDAEVSAHAESEAAAAASEAEKAAKGAGEAAAKALAAKRAAEVAAAEAERFAAASEVPADAAVSLAKHEDAEAEAAVATAAAPLASPPALPRELAASLHEEWRTLEQSYLDGLCMVFAGLKSEHDTVQDHFGTLRAHFQELLQRPDEKPALVAKFQAAFNAVEGDLRNSKEARAELLLRAEELREALWALCDKKMEEAEAARQKVTADSFVADRCGLIAGQFVAMAQVEADRFAAALNFLRSYVAARWAPVTAPREPPPAALPDVPAPDLLAGTVPHELKEKLEPKSKNAIQWPSWVAALEAKAPALAQAVKILIAQSRTTLAAWEPPSDDPKARAKAASSAAAAAKKKKAGEEDEPPTDPRVLEAISQELLAGAGREVQMMEQRLQLLADHCQSQLAEVATLASGTQLKLADWIKQRYKAECGAVSALAAVANQAAYEGRQLPADLRLEDELLLVDEGSLVVEPSISVPRPVPREAPLPGGLLNTRQLGQLTAAFLTAAPSGFMRLQEAADMMCRLAVEAVLPKSWRAASVTQMLGALRLYDPLFSTYLDWRELVAHLVVATCPLIARVDCAELADQVEICKEADKDKDGLLTQDEWSASDLWFQYKAFQPGSEVDLEADHAEPSDASEEPFDSPAAVKQVLWTLFSSGPADGSSPPLLNFRSCLLYLCADRDWFAGIKKAFSVAAGSISSNARADAAQVFLMAYPLGPEAGQELQRSPFSKEDVAAVVQTVFESRGGVVTAEAPPSVSAEQLMYSVGGERLAKRLFDRYAWKDTFVATKL